MKRLVRFTTPPVIEEHIIRANSQVHIPLVQLNINLQNLKGFGSKVLRPRHLLIKIPERLAN